MDRRLYSPDSNSDIIISTSDEKNIHFLNRGGLVIGSEGILESSNNVRFNRLSNDILEITSGNDPASEEEFSSDKGSLGIKSIIIGSNANQNNNVRIHRNANDSLQFVPGDDTTFEGNNSPNPLILGGMLLPGTIIAWLGGYFLDGNNSTYTNVLSTSDTASGANAYLNPLGWWVCDGSQVNVLGSPIFNTSGRFLPNLTDQRFLGGYTFGGDSGGSSSSAHTHQITPNVSVTSQPSFSLDGHYHSFGTLILSTESSTHGHNAGGFSVNSGNAGNHAHNYSFTNESGNDGVSSFNVECGNHTGYFYDISSAIHNHSFNFGSNSGDMSNSHTHNINGYVGNYSTGFYGDNTITATTITNLVLSNPTFTSSVASATENRPQYLDIFYIYRVF